MSMMMMIDDDKWGRQSLAQYLTSLLLSWLHEEGGVHVLMARVARAGAHALSLLGRQPLTEEGGVATQRAPCPALYQHTLGM